MNSKIETLLRNELLGKHVGTISSAVKAAYQQAEKVTKENPLLSVRNPHMSRGHNRYFMVQNSLWIVAQAGLLDGVDAIWNPVHTKFSTLTIETPSLSIEPVHVADENDKPKSGVTRDDRIATNQEILPTLEGLFPESGEKIHLFMLHGNQSLDFIRFACLDSLSAYSDYCYWSYENYAHTSFESKAAEEVVYEYEPRLLDDKSNQETGTDGK